MSDGVLLVPDLSLEGWRGMDRYADELVRRLPGAGVPAESKRDLGPRYLARYWEYPRLLRRYRPRLVHILDHTYAHCLRAFPGARSVVTVHDLYLALVRSEPARTLRARVRNRLLGWSLAWLMRAERWIAVSRFTASEATRLLGLPRERIAVAPNGVDEGFFTEAPAAAVEAQRRTWGEVAGRCFFVLHVGTCTPRKNVWALFGVLARLRAQGLDARLVQVGGTFTGAHRDAIAAARLAPSVTQHRRLDEASLRLAYRSADVLLIPSTYEGFCMPVLEAMASRLPVVASGAGGLADALGDAGLNAGSADAAALTAAVQIVAGDSARRADMISRGLAHARRHSWDAAARAVRQVYAELGVSLG